MRLLWLPIVLAVVCILLCIPLSRALKVSFWVCAAACALALFAAVLLPRVFEWVGSLQEAVLLLALLCAAVVLIAGAASVAAFVAGARRRPEPQTPPYARTRAGRLGDKGAAREYVRARSRQEGARANAPSGYEAIEEALARREKERELELALERASGAAPQRPAADPPARRDPLFDIHPMDIDDVPDLPADLARPAPAGLWADAQPREAEPQPFDPSGFRPIAFDEVFLLETPREEEPRPAVAPTAAPAEAFADTPAALPARVEEPAPGRASAFVQIDVDDEFLPLPREAEAVAADAEPEPSAPAAETPRESQPEPVLPIFLEEPAGEASAAPAAKEPGLAGEPALPDAGAARRKAARAAEQYERHAAIEPEQMTAAAAAGPQESPAQAEDEKPQPMSAALRTALEKAYDFMAQGSFDEAADVFRFTRKLSASAYQRQRVMIELLNVLMRAGRRAEATDTAFEILAGGYALSPMETEILAGVLNELQETTGL